MTGAIFFQPMVSTILRDRRLSSVICGAILLQLILSLLRLPGWSCPIFHTFGIPCPGCGMTRATLALFRGDWQQAITMHAFAPVFLLGLTLIAYCAIGPRTHIDRLVSRTETFERYSGITFLVLSGLILYWLLRLMILQTAFVRLIQN